MAKTGGKVQRLREIAKRKALVVSHGGYSRFAAHDQNPDDHRAGGVKPHFEGNNQELVALAAAAIAGGIHKTTIIPTVRPKDGYIRAGFTTANKLRSHKSASEVYNWLV